MTIRLAYFSDLHLDYRTPIVQSLIDGEFAPLKLIGFPETLEADVLVIPGDIHENPAIRRILKQLLEKQYDVPVILELGNHDHYRQDFPNDPVGSLYTVNGVNIATATLWSYLGPLDEVFASSFPDFRFINGITIDKWNQLHLDHVSFLMDAKADVNVTHHCPSFQSIHRNYAGDAKNCFYVSNLDLALYPHCSLWVHGHVHNEFDYVQDDIRVVCNPLGYPFEKHLHAASVRIVEVGPRANEEEY